MPAQWTPQRHRNAMNHIWTLCSTVVSTALTQLSPLPPAPSFLISAAGPHQTPLKPPILPAGCAGTVGALAQMWKRTGRHTVMLMKHAGDGIGNRSHHTPQPHQTLSKVLSDNHTAITTERSQDVPGQWVPHLNCGNAPAVIPALCSMLGQSADPALLYAASRALVNLRACSSNVVPMAQSLVQQLNGPDRFAQEQAARQLWDLGTLCLCVVSQARTSHG